MQREIKFRAWDGEEMYYFKLATIIPIIIDDLIQKGTVMQYTGLKDKNGKEIYERDIIKGEIWGKDTTQEIEWIEGIMNCGCCNEVYAVGFDFSDMDLKEIEIIGNIYENPELLK